VDVGPNFVTNVLIKYFEFICIHFSLIRNLFYEGAASKMTKLMLLFFFCLFFRVMFIRTSICQYHIQCVPEVALPRRKE
jgi:hypothetical protein